MAGAQRLRLKGQLRLNALYELLDLIVFAVLGELLLFCWLTYHMISLPHNVYRSKIRTVPYRCNRGALLIDKCGNTDRHFQLVLASKRFKAATSS